MHDIKIYEHMKYYFLIMKELLKQKISFWVYFLIIAKLRSADKEKNLVTFEI